MSDDGVAETVCEDVSRDVFWSSRLQGLGSEVRRKSSEYSKLARRTESYKIKWTITGSYLGLFISESIKSDEQPSSGSHKTTFETTTNLYRIKQKHYHLEPSHTHTLSSYTARTIFLLQSGKSGVSFFSLSFLNPPHLLHLQLRTLQQMLHKILILGLRDNPTKYKGGRRRGGIVLSPNVLPWFSFSYSLTVWIISIAQYPAMKSAETSWFPGKGRVLKNTNFVLSPRIIDSAYVRNSIKKGFQRQWQSSPTRSRGHIHLGQAMWAVYQS